MSDSPVRASAQEQAREIHDRWDAQSAYLVHRLDGDCKFCAAIIDALAAAEARGRQQAEQETPMPKVDKDTLISEMLQALPQQPKPEPDSKQWWEEVAKGLGVKLFDANRELSSIDAILSRRPALDLPTRWQNIEKAISVAARCEKAEAIAANVKAQNERLVARVQQAEQFEKNGIRVAERVVCIDVPRLIGTVTRCTEDDVRVRWDDGKTGDLIWDDSVAYNAYRLQIVRGVQAEQARDTNLETANRQLAIVDDLLGFDDGSGKGRVERIKSLQSAAAALTQALKDYGRHPESCPKGVGIGYYKPTADAVCNCGLDAALTGAQA